MIARLQQKPKPANPRYAANELRTESDVEQKLLYPFLASPTYLNIPSAWLRTKEYMSPTEIDKAAGKRYGYIPDYSVWLSGLPLAIVEAKALDVKIEVGLREARLYAGEINRRYPPEVNPIGYVLASNGEQIGLCEWDSETNVLLAQAADVQPGTAVFDAIVGAIGKHALETRAASLAPHFQGRRFWPVSTALGGQAKLRQQLGVNEFANPLFPVLTKYFNNTDDTSDDVIDRAYVTSDEITGYEGLLETFLKDRTSSITGNQLKTLEITRTAATGLTTEVKKFAGNPMFFSRVQLIVGNVGAGKSTFIRRYYRHLMTRELSSKTVWAFINFNNIPPDLDHLTTFIAEKFLASFAEVNGVDIYDLEQVERIFSSELAKFERGPAKLLQTADPADYARRRTSLLEALMADPVKFAECISRHFSGEKQLGMVIVFDNVDKRSRDQELKIFEASQWFKDVTKGLVLINLRDSTFEAHKDEPPLNAFINAINFYIRPPRFAQVIKKRMELVLETLPSEVEKHQEYYLSNGNRVRYPASRLGEFLMAIYLSLFDNHEIQVAPALEALVAKDVRRALGMFGDIIISPHVPTNQITGAAILGTSFRIPDRHIIRALMRGRYQYFNGGSKYIHDILSADETHVRPSNLLTCDILEYLIRNRKFRLDFQQEGYATVRRMVSEMGRLGYDEQDSYKALMILVEKGLVEPESHMITDLKDDDAVRVHASGFAHGRMLLRRDEYLVGVTTNLKLASRDTADAIGSIWSGAEQQQQEMSMGSKVRVLNHLKEYFSFEFQRRCRRHPFYEEAGFGGRQIIASITYAHAQMEGLRTGTKAAPRLGYKGRPGGA
ncbi:hypothetical protein NKI63_25930 [Mesorhizobium sp. M0410]|uniref:hypothetical protein n=1 Tax=Mesorhizobium sp. M0410 TaxID=2956943 RepID=UPI003334C2C1